MVFSFFGYDCRVVLMLTLCTSLFVASPVSGETYYVSLKGDDANDGKSEAAAFRTITKGVSVVRSGETVIIQSGDYGSEQAVLDSSGRKDAPIVIKADEPGKVILRGTGDGAGLRLKNKHYVVIEGIEFTNYSAGLTISRASSYITVRKCIFRNNRSGGLSLRGNKSRPTDSHHHLFTENQFLDLTPAYEGLTPGSDVRDTQDYGVYLYFATDVEVLNNYFHGHHHQALSFKKLMWNSRVAGNVFEGFQLSAMYLGQNTDSEEEGDLRCYNLVAEGNTFRPAPGYRAKTAIAVANVTGAIVRNNFMDSIYGEDEPGPTNLPGGGIQVHAMAVGTKIHNNVLVDVKEPKVALLIRADCEITNNTIAGCDRGLEIAEGVRAVVRNNIFYENRKSLGVAAPLGPKYGEYFGYKRA